jgi:hypothetical protein
MEKDAAQAGIPSLLLVILFLVISRFFILPAVCRIFPLQLPGGGFDFCFFFR